MLEYLGVVLGLVLLYKGADYLVNGSSFLAQRWGVSSLVIGLTIVAFGTSMPELVVNIFASLKGNAEISYGNIVGSNIFNILFILGIAAILVPLKVQRSTVWKEIPFALLAVLALLFLSNEKILNSSAINTLTRVDGVILLVFFLIFLYYIFRLMKETKNNVNNEVKNQHSPLAIFLMIAGGLAALYFGGKITVQSAVAIARQIGISDLLISSTIIAGGTSLPELVTSVVAVLRKEMDLSVGNIVGSNIFNIFWILGVSAAISPLTVPVGINFDFLVLLLATLLLFIFMFIGTRNKLNRWQGVVFILLYAAYVVMIIGRG